MCSLNDFYHSTEACRGYGVDCLYFSILYGSLEDDVNIRSGCLSSLNARESSTVWLTDCPRFRPGSSQRPYLRETNHPSTAYTWCCTNSLILIFSYFELLILPDIDFVGTTSGHGGCFFLSHVQKVSGAYFYRSVIPKVINRYRHPPPPKKKNQ